MGRRVHLSHVPLRDRTAGYPQIRVARAWVFTKMNKGKPCGGLKHLKNQVLEGLPFSLSSEVTLGKIVAWSSAKGRRQLD